MNVETMLESLQPEVRELVLPFVDEYKKLTEGEKIQISSDIVYFDYTDSSFEFIFDVNFKWNEGLWCDILLDESENNCLYPVQMYVAENSPQCRKFNNRIITLVVDMEKISDKHFGIKDQLWDMSFGKL